MREMGDEGTGKEGKKDSSEGKPGRPEGGGADAHLWPSSVTPNILTMETWLEPTASLGHCAPTPM